MACRWHTELKQLVEDVGGGTIEPTGGTHIKVRLNNGALVFVSNSPSDRRAKVTIRADLRRAARSGGDVHSSKSLRGKHVP